MDDAHAHHTIEMQQHIYEMNQKFAAAAAEAAASETATTADTHAHDPQVDIPHSLQYAFIAIIILSAMLFGFTLLRISNEEQKRLKKTV